MQSERTVTDFPWKKVFAEDFPFSAGSGGADRSAAPNDDKGYFTPLDDCGLLCLEGPDARKFLHGQSTADLAGLQVGTYRPGACCNPEGRVIAEFVCSAIEDNRLLLRMHRSCIPLLCDFLQKYLVFYRAEMQDKSAELAVVAISPAVAEEFFAAQLPPVGQCRQSDYGLLLNLEGQATELWCDLPSLKKLWSATSRQLWHSSRGWQLEMIEAGRAVVTAATSAVFLPQALDLQHRDAISFSKGCYTGQEIIARLQHRGKGQLKHHLYRGQLKSRSTPAPGTAVNIASSQTSCGTVVNAVACDTSAQSLLLSLQDRSIEQPLLLGQAEVEIIDLARKPETDQPR